jgi:hypothetical protein
VKLWTALVVIATVASCGGAPEPARPEAPPAGKPPEPAVDRARPGARALGRGGGPRIRLLEAGGEPRARLRYGPAAQRSETLLVTTKTSVAMGTPDLPGEPMDLPGTAMRMKLSVIAVDPNGDITFRLELLSVDVEPAGQPREATEALQAATRKLAGTGGRGKLTNRGIVEQLSIEMPSGADPATRELITEIDYAVRQIWEPLPEQPVGTGARWDVQTSSSLRGMKVDQVRRYTLRERGASASKLSFIVEQAAKPQPLQLPNAPPGARVRLEQLASAGDGEVTLDLSMLVPRASKLNLKTTNIISVEAEGRQERVRSDMQVELALSLVNEAKP